LAQTAYQSVSGQGEVRDFFALLKPRVMSLVVFTGFAGLAVAPGDLHPVLAAVAILCIAVASGAAGAINMWYDRDRRGHGTYAPATNSNRESRTV
jgi:heme O synthase-like polyprenyltransferase